MPDAPGDAHAHPAAAGRWRSVGPRQAMELIDSMTAGDISGYRDPYREALEELIQAKGEGQRRRAKGQGVPRRDR